MSVAKDKFHKKKKYQYYVVISTVSLYDCLQKVSRNEKEYLWIYETTEIGMNVKHTKVKKLSTLYIVYV